jgi:GTP-binding protein HflX
VESILRTLDLKAIPRVLVLNKCDRLPPNEAAVLCQRYDAVGISAFQPESLRPLIARLEGLLPSIMATARKGTAPSIEESPALASSS